MEWRVNSVGDDPVTYAIEPIEGEGGYLVAEVAADGAVKYAPLDEAVREASEVRTLEQALRGARQEGEIRAAAIARKARDAQIDTIRAKLTDDEAAILGL